MIEVSFKDFLDKDKIVKISFILAVVLNIFNWGLIYYRFARFLAGQEESIILHYNIYFGIDKIGNWGEIYYLPMIGIVILLINLFFGYILYDKDKLISYFFLVIAVFSQIFLNLATFFIILINQY